MNTYPKTFFPASVRGNILICILSWMYFSFPGCLSQPLLSPPASSFICFQREAFAESEPSSSAGILHKGGWLSLQGPPSLHGLRPSAVISAHSDLSLRFLYINKQHVQYVKAFLLILMAGCQDFSPILASIKLSFMS